MVPISGVVVMEWQPIETAPEDIGQLLLFTMPPRFDPVIGFFDDLLGGWAEFAHDEEVYIIDPQPTHWMHLPERPRTNEAGQ